LSEEAVMPEIKRRGKVSSIYDTGDRLNLYQDTNDPELFHIFASKTTGLPDGEVEIIIRWSEPKPGKEKAKDEDKTD